MNIQIYKSVFSRNCYNCFNLGSTNKFLSTSPKLNSKKQYRMKNKFTFQDDLKKLTLRNSRSDTCSPELSFEHNECKNDSTNFTHSIVSADLLSQDETRTRKRIVLPQKSKNRKPSLAYQGEILFGVHPVYLALLQKKRTFYHLYTREDLDSPVEDISRKQEIIKLVKSLNIPVSYVDSKGLRILAPGVVHQGICLDAGFLPLPFWNENECNMDIFKSRPLWLVLDEILDPMNVGAIIRSAYYFGVNALFVVRGNSCKLSPIVSKASSGTLEVMDIYQIGNLEEFVKKRKDSGWSVVSTMAYSSNNSEMAKSSISVNKLNTSRPIVLILGNEGKGISENILKLCDSLISIKPGQVLSKGIDSLNVSVATGVLLYALSNLKNET